MAMYRSYPLRAPCKSRSVEFFTTGGDTASRTRGYTAVGLETSLWPTNEPINLPRSETFSYAVRPRDFRDVETLYSSTDNSSTTMINCPTSIPSYVLLPPGSCYSDASFHHHHQPRVLPRHSNPISAAPPRRRGRSRSCKSASRQQPALTFNCVAWLKRLKVLKKVQSKFVKLGSRAGGSSSNSSSRLLFNSIHGDNVQISDHGTVARRASSFCKGVVFSDRPVKINEKICLRFVEVSTNWTGVLRVGFTNNDPSTLKSCLPKYACPDLTSKSGFWAKAFSDVHVKKDAILFYYVNPTGDVHFGINGEEKGVFFTGVDTRKPLWGLIDIYGNTTALELVDERAHLNNLKKSSSNGTASQNDVNVSIVPSLNAMRISAIDAPVMEKFPEVRHYTGVIPGSLLLHRTKGRHAEMGLLRCMAWRRSNEYANGYVFTANPIQPDEGVLIQVQQHDPEFASSMAFGVTSCDPDQLEGATLPDDSHCLLDRPEYWVVKKDAAICPVSGDELCFTMTRDGEIAMSKNGGPSTTLMFVDNSIPLWAFFDIYGTTTKIFLVGKVPASATAVVRPGPVEIPRFRLSTSNSTSNVVSILQHTPDGIERYNEIYNPRPRNGMPRSQSSTLPGSLSDCTRQANMAAGSECNGLNEKLYESAEASSKDNANIDVECVICCERSVDSVFYTCGHMCMCYQCATEYSKPNDKRWCPICRAPITDIIRTYKS